MQIRNKQSKRGFTLIELLVVMGIIALLLAILLPALNRARATAKRVKDSTQIQQIHKGFITLSVDSKGIYPTPGLIDRVGNTPGKGAEDQTQNSHANLYSACIMQNAFDTSSLISTAEVSTNVLAMANYNYAAYNVVAAEDQYWDPIFKANLSLLSNVSYGTLTLVGTRKAKEWTNTMNSRYAVLANRGVQDGSLVESIYNASKTLQIHGGSRQWTGNVAFNDNHVVYEDKFQPDGIQQITIANALVDDNIFKNDLGDAGSDVFLSMVHTVTGSGSTYTFQIAWD